MTPPPAPEASSPVPLPGELTSPAGLLLEHSAAATALADLGGRITYVNPAFLALWGYQDASQVVGRQAAGDFWRDPDAAVVAVSALQQQSVWQGELLARTASGETLPLRVTAQLLTDASGRPAAMLGNFVDISAEHAARAALTAERSFAELMFGSAGVLFVALDEDGCFVRFNPECERLSGWRADEVLGRCPWDTVLPPEVAATVRQEAFSIAMAAADLGQTTHYSNAWMTRDSERRLLEWTNRVTIDPTTKRRIMVSVGVDVTARHAAEQSLARSEAQLRVAQSVSRLGSWTLEIGSGRLDWSDEVFRLFEIDSSRFVPSYEAFLATIHPEDRDHVDAAYSTSLRTRKPYRIEHRLRMPDGRIKWVEERCETEFDGNGNPVQSHGTVQDVTERHLREVELLRLQHMVEHAPEEVWLTDASSRVVYANEAARSSLGYALEQLVGRCMVEIDADGEASVGRVVAALGASGPAGGGLQTMVVRHRRSDGRLVPKEIHATQREFDGVCHRIVFARDITEQLKAQQALAASEAQLRQTLDVYPGWVACVDADMRYVFVNAQFASVVGRPLDRILGFTADEVLGEHGREERWAVHRRLLAGEPQISQERRFVDKAGRERIAWVEYRHVASAGGGREPLLYAYGSDVTELRLMQQRVTAVTQDIGVGLWELTLPTQAVDFNDELLALVGCTREDVGPDALRWLIDRIDPADRPARDLTIQDLVAGRKSSAQVQIRVRHRLGHVVWVQEVLRIISRGESGHALRLIGVAQDISRLKAREAELEAMAADLEHRVDLRTRALETAKADAERANSAKSDFLSQMSHELRTPLNAIIGFGQLLEMSALPAQEGDYVQEVIRGGRHLLQLIDEILDLATVESGRLRLRRSPVALSPMVEECRRLLAPVGQAAGVDIEMVDLPAGAKVMADAGRLKQVLLNLLSNAIKYNRRGGRVLISVDAWAAGTGGWELRVNDTGKGLSADQIERLFQPFERLGAERTAIPGTGIGLTLSRRLTELMEGELGVSSRPGEGSTFWLRLPSAAEPAEAASDGAPGHEGALRVDTSEGGRHRQVLYVEDNEANQRLLVHLLKRREHIELRIAPTAQAAREAVCACLPDLLLIDIQLPDGDGHGLLGELRRLGVRAPAVAVSANAMAADLVRGQAAGFAEYLTKPLDLARVLGVIDRYLDEGDALLPD